MNKRGLSTVVTILIILLLTIVALGILWYFIKDFIIKQSELVKDREKYFTEELEIVKLRVEGKQFNITLRKTGGDVDTTEGIVQEAVAVDVFSIIDLSGSMASCKSITVGCCSSLGGYRLSDGNCYGVDTDQGDNCTNVCDGSDWIDRITPTKNASQELINTIFNGESNSRMGFVAYGTTVGEAESIDLTTNTANLNTVINSWQSYNTGGTGGTCICCGINEATIRLNQSSSEGKMKTMTVMSDGVASVACGGSPSADAIQAAVNATATLDDLTIYTVGVGTGIDEELLRNISKAGDGEYFSVTNISDLTQVYETIGQRIVITYESKHGFNYVIFIFSNTTESYEEISLEIPEVLGTEEYFFDLTGKLDGEIIKIEIYSKIVLDSGKEIIGPLMDSWEAK